MPDSPARCSLAEEVAVSFVVENSNSLGPFAQQPDALIGLLGEALQMSIVENSQPVAHLTVDLLLRHHSSVAVNRLVDCQKNQPAAGCPDHSERVVPFAGEVCRPESVAERLERPVLPPPRAHLVQIDPDLIDFAQIDLVLLAVLGFHLMDLADLDHSVPLSWLLVLTRKLHFGSSRKLSPDYSSGLPVVLAASVAVLFEQLAELVGFAETVRTC